VVTFDPETARTTAIGDGRESWADWLPADPDVRGAAGFTLDHQRENGAPEPDRRLIPLPFFGGGGAHEADNLVVRDAAAAMRTRDPITQPVHDLPDGARIRFGTS
jgi:hypothetical protein